MRLAIAGLLAACMTCYAGAASAGCQVGQRLNQTELNSLLPGNTVCGRPVVPADGGGYPYSASDRWQEEHRGTAPGPSQLWDYKKGPPPAEKIDPTKQVGTWEIVLISSGSGNSPDVYGVRHAYTGGPTFTWTMHKNPPSTTVYSFCTGGVEHVRATVKTGIGVGCAAGDFPP